MTQQKGNPDPIQWGDVRMTSQRVGHNNEYIEYRLKIYHAEKPKMVSYMQAKGGPYVDVLIWLKEAINGLLAEENAHDAIAGIPQLAEVGKRTCDGEKGTTDDIISLVYKDIVCTLEESLKRAQKKADDEPTEFNKGALAQATNMWISVFDGKWSEEMKEVRKEWIQWIHQLREKIE